MPEAFFGPDPRNHAAAHRGEGIGASLRYAMAVLRRNLWLAAAIVALALTIAVALAMLTSPRYTALSTVQINDQSESVLGSEIDKSAAANTSWDVDRFLNTQLDVLRSRGIAERVARKLDLERSERFFAARESPPPGSATSAKAKRDQVVGLLTGNLSIDLPRETRIVRLAFTSTDAELSALIANTFAEEFVQANLQRRYDSTAYARNFVAEQLAEARTRLEASERDLNAYARNAGLIRTREVSPDGNGGGGGSAGNSITTSSLLQLNTAANDAEAARVAAEARWLTERNTPLLSSGTVLANSTVQTLMTRRSDVQAQLATARARYLGGHPTIERLETDLDSIDRELNRTAATVRNSVRAQYEAALATERRLQGQVRRLRGDTLAEQDRTVRYNTLAREADTNRSIYDGLLQRFRELNAASGIAVSNLSIIDRADPPSGPSSPNMVKNIALALLAGGGLALLAVFMRDQFDDRIRVPEDVESKIHLTLLGVIPRVAGQTPLSALADPKSAVSEGYNSLRGALLYSTPDGLPKVMVITSAQATEGKTTTSYAIALSMARLGKRVVLVDADMRRPSIHNVSGLSNKRGLSDLLVSRDPAESAIQASGQAQLEVITAGPLPADPTGLLAGPRVAQLLEALAASHDVVIVDSPPVLGLADAPMLAALADGTILVVEADRARRGNLKSALRRLKSFDPLLLGTVLTKFDSSKGGNSYSSYYGDDYYSYKPAEAVGIAAQ